MTETAKPAKLPLKARLTALFERYGMLAIIVYVTLSVLTTIAFAVAIWTGAKPSTDSGIIGVLIAAWLAGKATMPLRIPIAIALTPVVDRLVRRRRPA